MFKIRYFLLLVFLFSISGCKNVQYEIEKFFGAFTMKNRHIDVFVDVTKSRNLNEELPKDKQFITNLIKNLGANDVLHVYLIHARTFSRMESIFNGEMPSTPGAKDLNLIRTKRKLLAEFPQKWDKALAYITKNHLNRQTDILGIFLFLKDHNIKCARHSVVILSDMLAYKPNQWNFQRHVPTEKLLDKWQQNDEIPELTDIHFYVFGAYSNSITNDQYIKIRKFWQEYFRRCGATLKSYQYERESKLVLN